MKNGDSLLKEYKELFLESKSEQALKRLSWRYCRNKNHEGMRKCIQYVKNRPGQFEYARAKEQELPIGSGKIESTHRALMQKRLKKSGTWWLRSNAEKMANLRVARANGCWKHLWEESNYKGYETKEAA